MSNELKVIDSTKIAVLNKMDLGEVLKPFQETIFLKEMHIAGTTYIKDQSCFESLQEKSRLDLVREKNPHDDLAIRIEYQGQKLGYVPRIYNEILAHLLDGGKRLYASVLSKELKREDYYYIRINIYLEEF